MLRRLGEAIIRYHNQYTYRERFLFFAFIFAIAMPLPTYWMIKTEKFIYQQAELALLTNQYSKNLNNLLSNILLFEITNDYKASPELIKDLENIKNIRKKLLSIPSNHFSGGIFSLVQFDQSILAEGLWSNLDNAIKNERDQQEALHQFISGVLKEANVIKYNQFKTAMLSSFYTLFVNESFQNIMYNEVLLFRIYKMMKNNSQGGKTGEDEIKLMSLVNQYQYNLNRTRELYESAFAFTINVYQTEKLRVAKKVFQDYLSRANRIIGQIREGHINSLKSEAINVLEFSNTASRLSSDLIHEALTQYLHRLDLTIVFTKIFFVFSLVVIIFYVFFRVLTGHLLKMQKHIENMSKGEFPSCFCSHAKDDFGKVGLVLDQMGLTITKLMKELGNLGDQLVDSSTQLTKASVEQENAVTKQEIDLGKVEATAQKIEADANRFSQSMQDLIKSTRQKGLEAKARASLDILHSKVNELIGSSRHVIDNLKEAESSIADASIRTAFLARVSNKANMLSLNAAIETANSDTSQYQFKDISLKIQRFASRTSLSSRDIKEIISQVARGIAGIRQETEASLREINEGIGRLIGGGRELERITMQGHELLRQFEIIGEVALKQTGYAKKILSAISHLKETVQQNAVSIKEIREKVDELGSTSKELKSVVEITYQGKQ